MSLLKKSWSAFAPEVAKIYLDGFGHPSPRSKELMASLLLEQFADRPFKLVDFGCGNGHLAGYFRSRGLNLTYVGCDFSTSLLDAARERFAGNERVSFLEIDIEDPEAAVPKCDIVLYSHVLETLQSPQKSLLAARGAASTVMIRFFEPPIGDYDITAIGYLNTGGDNSMPYLRRTMSRNYYNLLLTEVKCAKVEVHHVDGDKDEVHLLIF